MDTIKKEVQMYKYSDKKKAAVMATYRETHGNLTETCRVHKISRQTFANWREKDPDFAAEAQEVREECGDIIESALMARIEAGDTTAIIFALKTKYKDRGWTERNEMQLDVTATKPVQYADIMPHGLMYKDFMPHELKPGHEEPQ